MAAQPWLTPSSCWLERPGACARSAGSEARTTMGSVEGDRPRVAVVDYVVTEQSPPGSCHLRIVEALRGEIDFTVFATEFDNPDPTRIEWVRVHSVARPLAARFLSFYATSTVALARPRHAPVQLIQGIESCTHRQDISYVHFCHRAFLRHHWRRARPTGLRRLAHYVNHRVRAAGERRSVRRASLIVVPSEALARELRAEYAIDLHRVRVIPNPVAVEQFRRP